MTQFPDVLRVPACAVNLLARPAWFRDPGVIGRARLEWMDTSVEGIRLRRFGRTSIARLFSSPRFSGTEDVWAITLGATIYVRAGRHYDPHTPNGLSLLAHELKHIEQYERQGTVAFFAKYLAWYGYRGGYGKALPLEQEAYAFQDQVYEHLLKEFERNVGVPVCREMSAPHTPNAGFLKIKPNP